VKKGWQIKTIGDVCDLATGGTPSRTKPEYFGGNIKWLVSGDINQGEIFDCEGRITEAGKKNSNAKLLPVNSVMIALNGQGKTRGTVALLRTEATCNQSMVSISPKLPSGLIPEFLHANLHGRYEEIRRMTSDDDKDRRGLNMGIIRSIEIPIAPLEEQKRIVAKLDEAFVGLAKAKENAEKNLQNARALFESHLDSVFIQRGSGWVETRLDEACEIIMGQSPDGESYNTTGEGVPLINGPVEFSRDSFGKTVRSKFTTQPTKFCKKDDLILCVRGSTTGRMNIAGFDACVGRGVAAIRSREYQPWINHFINAKREEIYRLGTGATFPNVSGAILGALKLSIPALSAQREIVAMLESLRKETQRLARIYEQKLEALESLKKSILHEAFSGNL
jgi:type I restriction enzyme, S subunit